MSDRTAVAGSDAAVQAASIPAELARAAQDSPEVLAVVDGDETLTYAQLEQAAHEVAAALIAQGVRPGDPVALWAPNSIRWITAAYGILCAGGILAPLNTRNRGPEAAYAVNLVHARILLVTDDFLGTDYVTMIRGAGDLPELETMVSLADQPAAENVLGWKEFLLSGSGHLHEVRERVAALRPGDVADILFTSGTTGYPKGAMVTHGSNLITNLAWARGATLQPGDRYLLVNPLFHSFGYRAGMLACLQMRATIHPLPVFDVSTVLDLIESAKITMLPGAPTIFSSLLADESRHDRDLSSLRVAITGAAMVPVPLITAMREDLQIAVVLTAYGLTESCGTATMCPTDADVQRISTTSGVAIPGVEVEIHDAAGRSLPAGESGEIVVRGPNVMLGYFENDQATAETIDAEGWLHTGDVGSLDELGYLTITDRMKDMFTTGGFNVYPAEVERVLLDHPAVADAAVVGVPDERLGEVARAFVVLRPVPQSGSAPVLDLSTQATDLSDPEKLREELWAYCRAHLANYKVPRLIEVCEVLPRNAGGKLQKFKLRDDPRSARGESHA